MEFWDKLNAALCMDYETIERGDYYISRLLSMIKLQQTEAKMAMA